MSQNVSREHLYANGWRWSVAGYYGPGQGEHKPENGLALETVHKDEASADLEVSSFEKRADIGHWQKVPIHP